MEANRQRIKYLFFILVLVGAFTQSCRKDSIYSATDAMLEFSEDTVHFDTVFTTVGSITLPLKLYNNYTEALLIENIQLQGGDASQFRINVDGESGINFSQIEIPANDSLYLFIEVTVDPNNDALPYVIEDLISFTTNGNLQDVKLIAYGQNAHFYYGQILCDTTWTDDLPHVIIGSVLVDTLCALTITEGTNIYLHGGSYFYVLGTLNVLGTKDSIVTFQGDRLEEFYEDVPGQWEGIYLLRGSFDNIIRYAEIKNANQGINMGLSTNPDVTSFYENQPELIIENSKIFDCQLNGITAINCKIDATNTLIYNCGGSNSALFLGGDYYFKHCTLGAYSSDYLAHQTPALGITDYFAYSLDLTLQNDLTRADFTNCIIYGSIAEGNEIVIDTLNVPTVFNFNFSSCVLRTDINPDLLNDTGCFFNVDPQFANIGERNYCPTVGSPAINAGIAIPISPVLIDINGEPRPFGATLPDIGCYETSTE